MKYYHSFTTPILNYYANQGIRATINANQGIGTVWTDLLNSLN